MGDELPKAEQVKQSKMHDKCTLTHAWLIKDIYTSLEELTSRPHLSESIANHVSRLKDAENNLFSLKNISEYCLSCYSFVDRKNRKLMAFQLQTAVRGGLVSSLILF